MNPETLSFLNRQLATLLSDGVPLPQALRQASIDLRGPIRKEIEALEQDLGRGIPLDQAVQHRRLPPLYLRILRAGIAANNLPAALLAAADHFDESARLRRNLQSALAYPILVLGVGALVSALGHHMNRSMLAALNDISLLQGDPMSAFLSATWINLGLLAFFVVGFLGLILPPMRRWITEWLPPFRDGRLAQMAQSFHLLLQSGCPLPEAIQLIRSLEPRSRLSKELAVWSSRLEQGVTRLADVTAPASRSERIPRFFRWLVLSRGDRLAEGFERAGKHYADRARHRLAILTNGITPVATILLGILIATNFLPTMHAIANLFVVLGGE